MQISSRVAAAEQILDVGPDVLPDYADKAKLAMTKIATNHAMITSRPLSAEMRLCAYKFLSIP